MGRQILTACCLLAIVATAGCGSQDEGDAKSAYEGRDIKKVIAYINPRSGSDVGGSAIFIKQGDQITLQVSVESTPPGEHAVRIHENGDCSSDGKSAGGHWNPAGAVPAPEGEAPPDLGTIGTIAVGEDGTGMLSLTTDRWSMGTGAANDIIEKAVIVFEGADEFKPDSPGEEGARIGCGIILVQ
jgi:Cu-Zn family superoxide dismutase